MKFLYLIVIIFSFQLAVSQVGINTLLPLSTLDINGNLSVKTITLVGSGTATLITDGIYISISPQATDQEFRLPSAVLFPGRIYIIRNIQNAITAKLTSVAGTLFPKNSTTGSTEIFMFENNLRTVTVVSDGLNWTYIN